MKKREFACGAIIRYSPNFSAEYGGTPCPKHPKEAENIFNRKEAKRKLVSYIRKLKVDDDYIKRLLSDVEYT